LEKKIESRRKALMEVSPFMTKKLLRESGFKLGVHWIITDGNGKMENVWGSGVVGEQLTILSGISFEYSSAWPLNTPNGRMEGDFEMIHIDKVGSRSFNVAIAPRNHNY
ncbi:hypothetical protein S83_055481, partial [Arachis hypogaea]